MGTVFPLARVTKAGRGDKAAKVCDVRVQKDITACNPSAGPACEDTLRDSRGRGIGKKNCGSAFGIGRDGSVDTTRDGNSFTRQKALAHHRYGAAGCGIERRAIEEYAGRVLISDRWRTGIGTLFEAHSGHTPGVDRYRRCKRRTCLRYSRE